MGHVFYLTLASILLYLIVARTEAVHRDQDDNEEFDLNRIYTEEFYKTDYEVTRVEENLDTRVANMLYLISVARIVEREHHVYNFANNPGVASEYESYINRPEVDQKLCKQHLTVMNTQLDELNQILSYQREHGPGRQLNSSAPEFQKRHVRLARVLDSFGRYESGLVYGRNELLGSYEQCLESNIEIGSESGRQLVGMRYCKASLAFTEHMHPSIRNKSEVYLQSAVCLPVSCHSNSLQDNKHLIQRLVDSQFALPQSMFVSKHRPVIDLYCLNDKYSSIGLPLAGKVFVLCAAVWTILLIAGSCYGDCLQKASRKSLRAIGESFNAKQLMSEFLEYGQGAKKSVARLRINLDALNFVKVIGMLSIVIGHSVMAGFNAAPDGVTLPSRMRKNPFMTMLIYIQLMVDTFFVMSGLLFSYIVMKKYKAVVEASKSAMQVLKLSFALIFFRYIRLVPMYFLIYWFKRSVFIYLGWGPMWDLGFNKKTPCGGCKEESWLTPFTPLAAYMPTDRQCLITGWSLACEIVFMFLTTPVVIILIKRPKVGMFVSLLLGLFSWVMMYGAYYRIDQVDLDSFNKFKANFIYLIFAKHSNLYTNAHLRLSPVFGGLVGGYFLYYYERSVIKRWPNWFANYATKLAVASFFLNFLAFAAMPLVLRLGLHEIEIVKNPFMHLAITSRIVWSMASVVVLMRLVSDWKDGFNVKLLSGKFIRIMTKFNLPALLINMDIVYIKNALGSNHIPNYTFSSSLSNGVSGYVYTVVFATLVHVLVECPINKLLQLALPIKKDDVRHKKQS